MAIESSNGCGCEARFVGCPTSDVASRATIPRRTILSPSWPLAFPGPHYAKRTQFPATPGGTGPQGAWNGGRIVRNEANLGRSLKCEVSRVKRIVQNEANLGRGGACRAKRSQSPGRTWGQTPYGVTTNPGPSAPNKANLGRPAAQTNPIRGRAITPNKANLPPRASRTVAGAKRAKQSQFRRSGRTGKYLVEKELWRIEHAQDLRKTKPMCPGPTARGAGPGPEMPPPAATSVQNEANFRRGPTRCIWNPPPYAGRTRRARRGTNSLPGRGWAL